MPYSPREDVKRHYPWDVPAEYQTSLYHCIRIHGEYMATGGKGMSDDDLDTLRSFYQKLRRDNVVVEYDPTLPPSEDAPRGRWGYRPRVLDDDGLIHPNEHTTITELGAIIWRFPPEDP